MIHLKDTQLRHTGESLTLYYWYSFSGSSVVCSALRNTMSCSCVNKACYALKCAGIPLDIMSSISCSRHSKQACPTAPSENWVSFVLSPDTAVSESEDISKWPIVYHGTAVAVINSIITHGMLMMLGDCLCDGTVLGKRCAGDDKTRAIWTYPQPTGALCAAGTGTFDGGQTEFKILITLRQKPGTYEVHKKAGFGYDVWSTNKRGTLLIEALDVYVVKSRGTVSPCPPIPPPQKSYKTTFRCPLQQQAFDVLKLLKLPQSFFNMDHNRCYCDTCYKASWPRSVDVAGETYAIPLGWTRFGLQANPVFAKVNDIWKSWQIAFHGCHPANVVSIVKNRTLLIPHDVLPDGRVLEVWSSADKNQKYYFLSPEIGYSAHPWYAKPIPFTDKDGKRKYFSNGFGFQGNVRNSEVLHF
jgi:hypothetical protein